MVRCQFNAHNWGQFDKKALSSLNHFYESPLDLFAKFNKIGLTNYFRLNFNVFKLKKEPIGR